MRNHPDDGVGVAKRALLSSCLRTLSHLGLRSFSAGILACLDAFYRDFVAVRFYMHWVYFFLFSYPVTSCLLPSFLMLFWSTCKHCYSLLCNIVWLFLGRKMSCSRRVCKVNLSNWKTLIIIEKFKLPLVVFQMGVDVFWNDQTRFESFCRVVGCS